MLNPTCSRWHTPRYIRQIRKGARPCVHGFISLPKPQCSQVAQRLMSGFWSSRRPLPEKSTRSWAGLPRRTLKRRFASVSQQSRPLWTMPANATSRQRFKSLKSVSKTYGQADMEKILPPADAVFGHIDTAEHPNPSQRLLLLGSCRFRSGKFGASTLLY